MDGDMESEMRKAIRRSNGLMDRSSQICFSEYGMMRPICFHNSEKKTLSPPAIGISERRGGGGKEKSNGAALPAIQFTELSLRLTLRANIHYYTDMSKKSKNRLRDPAL